MALMLDLISKFSQASQLVLCPFGGTFSTAKACLSADKDGWFIRGKLDSGCIRASLPGLVGVYAMQLLNSKADLTLSTELLDDEKKYGNAINGQKARRKANENSLLDVLCPI